MLGVVVAISNASPRRANTGGLTTMPEGNQSVLATLVGVMDNVVGISPIKRHFERVDDKFGPQVVGHRPPYDAPAVRIDNNRQINE